MSCFVAFFPEKNMSSKISVVFHHLKKDSPVFVQKLAQNESLLFGTFDLLNVHCVTQSALVYIEGESVF